MPCRRHKHRMFILLALLLFKLQPHISRRAAPCSVRALLVHRPVHCPCTSCALNVHRRVHLPYTVLCTGSAPFTSCTPTVHYPVHSRALSRALSCALPVHRLVHLPYTVLCTARALSCARPLAPPARRRIPLPHLFVVAYLRKILSNLSRGSVLFLHLFFS